MATEMQGGDSYVNGQRVWHTGNLNPARRGKADHLWSGAHFMDKNEILTLNCDFSNYKAIVCDCCIEPNGPGGHMFHNQVWMPTAWWVNIWSTYDHADLSGDDWCAALLHGNNIIYPFAGAGVWIMNVYGVR